MSVKLILVLSLLFNTLLPLFGQQVRFEHLDIKNGLSQNSANHILQDSYGFIWIATEDGINRFDGKEIKIYRHSINNKGSLSNNFCRAIYEDQEHNLMVMHNRSVSYFNRTKNTFTEFLYPNEETELFLTSVSTASGIIVATNKALYKVTSSGLTTLINVNNCNTICNYHNGYILYSSGKSIYSLQLSSLKKKMLHHMNFQVVLLFYYPALDVFTIAGPENILIQKTGSGKQYDYSKKADALCGKGNIAHSFLYDRSGNLWIGSRNGLLKLYKNKLDLYVNEDGNPHSLSKDNIRCCYEDQSGLLWFGTYGGGINIYHPNRAPFFTVSHQKNKKQSLSGNFVLSFTEDHQHRIWIGTDGNGLNCWDRTTNTFNHYHSGNAGLEGNTIFCMAFARQLLLLGTSAGIEIFDTTTKKISAKLPFETTNDEHIKCFYKTSKRTLYCGSTNGLYELHLEQMKKTPVPEFNGIGCRFMTEDKDGTLWIGTASGIVRWNKQGIQHFLRTSKTGAAYTVSSLIIQDSIIWISTTGTGLIRFNKDTYTHSLITSADGLPNELVYGMLSDTNQQLWMSTNSGISRYHIPTGTFKNYSVNDGLQSTEFNGNAFFSSSDGYFFFGGVEGFNYFNPSAIRVQHYSPRMYITGISLFEKELLADSVIARQALYLSHTSNYIGFRFAAFDYTAPHNIRYRYKLEGYDHDWVNLTTGNIARYNNLPPGNYTFCVSSTNSEGIWVKNEISIPVIIVPPFWRKTWFVAFLFFAIIALVWGGISMRIRFIQKRASEKSAMIKQMAELEMKALRAQMNPHFIFNALNSIQNFILDNNSREASKYLSRFAKLIRMILDNAETPVITVARKIEFLKLYIEIEALRFNNEFEYDIVVSDKINLYETEIPNMLIQPFVENAIWHGLMHKTGNRHIEIHFFIERVGLLCCQIKDNGIGRTLANEKKSNRESHTSRALHITQERMNILNMNNQEKAWFEIIDQFDKKGQAAGTCVNLFIPINHI